MDKQLYNGRAKIKWENDTTIIHIPSKKNMVLLFFYPFWFGAWYIGFKMVGKMIQKNISELSNTDYFIIFWLGAWIVGGLYSFVIFLWNAFGKETIKVFFEHISISKNIFGIGIKKIFKREMISNMRINKTTTVSESLNTRLSKEMLGLEKGSIFFDYGMRTINFGLHINDPEAQYLIDIINGVKS